MGWLWGGYFGGWYVLLGVGYARWLTQDPEHRGSWAMVAFGAVAYFLLIPGLLFGLMPVFEKSFAKSEAAIREGVARRAVGRGYAFAVGLVGSLVAMATCSVGAGAASLSSDTLSEDRLGENGLAVVFVALMMGATAVIAVCPWLGMRLLLMRCRLREPGARRAWAPWVVPFALAMAWAGPVGWLGYRVANATSVMTARLDFAELPASDEPLQGWLRSQPGIVAADVRRQGDTLVVECAVSAHRGRCFARTGDAVTIEYAPLAGERHTLQLTRAAAELGYRDLRDAKFETPKRSW